MPTVPVYDNFKVAQTGDPDVATAAPSGPNALQVAGDQISRLGEGAQRASDAATRIALSVQDQVNQTRVADAVNQAHIAAQDLAYNPQTGYLALKGKNAVDPIDGQPLPDAYGSKLKEEFSRIGSTLGNPEQQRLFQLQSGALHAQFLGQAEHHMMTEFQNYRLATFDARINVASDSAALNYYDANAIADSVNAVKAATMEKAQALGMQGYPAQAALLAAVSHVHTRVIQANLENGNAQAADAYLAAARQKGEMSGDDILKLQLAVNRSVWSAQALGATQAATSAAVPRIMPSYFDRMANITLGAESGGRDTNADGSPVVSSAGAKYGMQVMPDTAANPGHGIAPAASDSPAEYNRVGRQLLQALLQKYGDPAKAWAAYNWGEGNLDKALRDQASNRAGTQGASWLSYVPKETRDYVAKNATALAGSGGMPAPPTEMEFVNDVVSRLGPNAVPQAVSMARESAQHQFTVLTKTIQEQGNNAVSTAQRWLIDNPGQIQQMPLDMRAAVERYAPAQWDNLVKFDHVNGSDEFKHSNPRLVNDLTQRIYLPDGDPRKITQPGQIMEFMGKGLAYGDQQRLVKEMRDANTPEGSPFMKQVANVKATGQKMIVGNLAAMNPVAMKYPDIADEAAYRFGLDLDSKVKQAREKGIDPQTLFTPGSKDYVLDPNRVAAFMPTEAQIVARQAGALKPGALATGAAAATAPTAAQPAPAAPAARAVPRLPGETPADYLKRIGMS